MKILGEKWKNFRNTNYQISTYGGVRRKKKNGRYYYLQTTSLDRYGYPKVSISIDGKTKIINIHRLVAEVFIPNPDPKGKPMVNHLDGNKENNRVNNLEWCDGKRNMRHAYNTSRVAGKMRTPVLAIKKDWSEVIGYPSLQEAYRHTGAGPKEIRQATQSWSMGVPRLSAKGFYWLNYKEYDQFNKI